MVCVHRMSKKKRPPSVQNTCPTFTSSCLQCLQCLKMFQCTMCFFFLLLMYYHKYKHNFLSRKLFSCTTYCYDSLFTFVEAIKAVEAVWYLLHVYYITCIHIHMGIDLIKLRPFQCGKNGTHCKSVKEPQCCSLIIHRASQLIYLKSARELHRCCTETHCERYQLLV